jgi:hypothetical protein
VTITRRGSNPLDHPPARVSLKRVQVTIDDLQALRETIQRLTKDQSLPEVEFDGGTFDDSSDLASLADEELHALTIKSKSVEIRISYREAVAIGDKKIAQAIYQDWARTRQLPKGERVPREALSDDSVRIWLYPLIVAAGIAVVLIDVLLKRAPLVTNLPIAIGLTLVLGVLLLTNHLDRRGANFALIIPQRLKEYRDSQSAQNKHREILVTTIVGIVCAALGVFATILFQR